MFLPMNDYYLSNDLYNASISSTEVSLPSLEVITMFFRT